jgi:hypothetical protein
MNFQKLYYISFFEHLLASDSTETRVLAYIIRHMSYDNYVYIRYGEGAKIIGRCDDTVGRVIRNLESCDFLRPHGPHRYMVNPTCIHNGSANRCEKLSEEFFGITN